MSIPNNELALLYDICISCKHILSFIKDYKFIDYERDIEKQSSVERQIEIIGQISTKLSKDTRDTLNQIPWKSIIGARNIIAHDYGEILVERVWFLASESVPTLYNELLKIDELKEFLNE